MDLIVEEERAEMALSLQSYLVNQIKCQTLQMMLTCEESTSQKVDQQLLVTNLWHIEPSLSNMMHALTWQEKCQMADTILNNALV